MTSTSRDHWDRLAPRYDEASVWVERRFLAPGRQWAVGRAHGRTLEIGIGTGANLDLYAADVDLVGVDSSEGMLKQARRKLSRRSASQPAVELRPAEAGALPFDDASFDCVVSTAPYSAVRSTVPATPSQTS